MNTLQKAIKKRDEFLEKNPNLKALQKEVDNILDKCREEDRLAAINMMMMQKVMELQRETMKLQKIITKY
jgi:hypothetical protein